MPMWPAPSPYSLAVFGLTIDFAMPPPTHAGCCSMWQQPIHFQYVFSLFDDPYDRCATRPTNVPTPQCIEKPLPQIFPRPLSAHRSPRSLKTCFTPPGFAKPIMEFPRNWDGPAMRTYEIAWQKEGGFRKIVRRVRRTEVGTGNAAEGRSCATWKLVGKWGGLV
ncbi:hypothetical protein I312_100707 [Cryptococcus bacillisporus CA1280]|uniref:uncharacterized protein n=1 Tax=Cryptococcus bacillisporus CA1280 TaxID=1296109 RepID=UPI003365ECC8